MRKHAILLGAVLLGLVSVLSYAQAPVPFISLPLMPDAVAPGGPQFTLTVNGTGFVSKSVVNWNSSALQTQFVSGSQLTAIVPAADIATARTGWVTVVNPAPGGGTSSAAFFSVTANEGNSVPFILTSSPPAGDYPYSVAVGDFNGDGKLDLAVANYEDGTVSILLGDGTGSFSLASSTPACAGPEDVAVGDFNGDGKLDLAVANNWNNNVSILLGDGTGHFTLSSTPATGWNAISVAVGDFNGDGKLDLAVAAWNGGVSILLGDGTGQFTLASSPVVGSYPTSVAVGDFNGDGKLDLAVTNSNDSTVSILLGDGAGNFSLVSSPGTGGVWPWSVVVGDFNGDGKLDLAVANNYYSGPGNVSILLGDGTGNFTLTSSMGTNYPYSLTVGDFNGDGKLDLAAVGSQASIFLGDGTGNFTLASSPPLVMDSSVASGDFNGDGKLDLAVAGWGSWAVSVLLQPVSGASAVTLSPPSLNFGMQLVGISSTPQPVTLTNTGSETLKISKIAANNVNFSQTNNCSSSIASGAQCTINVTFDPHRINTLNGTVTIKDNASNSPQTVPLTGVGTVVTLLPSSLDFGNQPVGTTSQPQVATLTNYGQSALSISRIHITGTNPGAFTQTNTCGTSVPAGGSCTISVTFTPHAKGPKTATLKVFDNGGASPQTVALSGTGTK